MNFTTSTVSARALWMGVAAWLLFSIVAVALYGPYWDESYEHAQVLRGDIPYPDGHPMRQYMFGAYTVQHYVTAALMALSQHPAWICGFRGVMSLAMTTVPLFLLAAALSQRAVFGHAAVIVALSGAFGPFASTYPLVVWWSSYSNGQIGMGFALLALSMLCLRRWRTAALLAGVMPAVHLGQWPPVLGIGLIAIAVAWRWGPRRLMWQSAAIAASGLLGCLLFALIQRAYIPALPESGAYALQPTAAAIDDVWRGFTFAADGHRALPPLFTLVAAILPGVLGALVVWQRRREPALALDASWPWAYAVGTAVVVGLIAVVQTRLGSATPFALISWMPYRLLNHLPFVTTALAMGAMAMMPGRRQATNLGLAAVAVALTPALGKLIGGDFMDRYVSAGDGVLFAIAGMGLGVLILRATGRDRALAVGGLVLTALAIGAVHRFGGACLLVAAGIPCVLSMLGDRSVPATRTAVALATVPVVLHFALAAQAGALRGPRMPGEWMPVREAIAPAVSPTDIVMGHPYSRTMQGRLHQPVYCDAVVAWIISYDTALGPLIDQMYQDGYGISLAESTRSGEQPHWTAVWKARRQPEWEAFGARYGVRFVLAPPEAQPLDLPVLEANPGGLPDILYQIPQAGGD